MNGYPRGFIGSVIKSKSSRLQSREVNPLGSVHNPDVKGVSEKFKRIGNQYNIRMVFRAKHTLMRTRTERDPQQTVECVYSIPCECGSNYIGETGGPQAVRLRQHRHNLNVDLLEESKLYQQAYEEVMGSFGKKLDFRQMKVTASIENTKNRIIWQA
jgi:hypothetical protein